MSSRATVTFQPSPLPVASLSICVPREEPELVELTGRVRLGLEILLTAKGPPVAVIVMVAAEANEGQSHASRTATPHPRRVVRFTATSSPS